MTVNLTGVTDVQKITLTLADDGRLPARLCFTTGREREHAHRRYQRR